MPAQPPYLAPQLLTLCPQVTLDTPNRAGYTAEQLRAHYGLKAEEVSEGLKHQIDLFVKTATDTGINLTRHGMYTRPQAPSTMARTLKDIHKFFGFLKTHKAWKTKGMRLSAYSNVDLVTDFLRFLTARQVASNELVLQVALAVRVNIFMANLLSTKGERGVAAAAQFSAAVKRLQAMRSQLSSKRRSEKGADIKCVSACVRACACARSESHE
jgi:hypothetical protein